jgi:hypothetical protein
MLMADDDDDDNDNNDNQTDPATTEVWMTTDLAKIEARMTRDLATMAVFSSEEDCSCSCSGFTGEEWVALKRLREADGVERNQVTMADDIDDIIGALGRGNETTGSTIDEGAV